MRRLAVTAGGLAVALVLVVASLLWADGIGDSLRREAARLSPYRLLAVVGVTGLVVAVISFARANGISWPWGRRLAHETRLRLLRVPAGLALPVIVAVAAMLRISLSYEQALPQVFADELIFADLAKSFAEHGSLLLRGVPDNGHSLLYPVFVSPVYALADDGVAALRTIQILNSLAMALTAVPAYYLARRVLPHGWSLAIALLSALAPATAYAAFVMTESLFYPAFVTAALAVVLMLERPTPARQLVALALVVALIAVRAQALALVPAVATAALIDGWCGSGLRSRVRSLWPTWTGLALFAVAGVVALRAGASAPTGSYGELLRPYDPVELARWLVWNVAGYELAVGVVAVAALPAALTLLVRRGARPGERALGATTFAFGLWLFVSVAMLSASPYGLDVLHQRSLFYVTPLVLSCFAYWLVAGMPRSLGLSLGVGAAVVFTIAVLPERVFMSAAFVDSPTNVLWTGLSERLTDVPVRWFVVGAAIVGTAVFLHARTPILPVLSFVVTSLFVIANFDPISTISRPGTDQLAWIDRVVPSGEHAALVHVAIDSDRCPAGANTYQGEAVTWSEFFNLKVDRVYHVFDQVRDDGLESPELRLARDGTLLLSGAPLRRRYVALDSRVRIHGTELAQLDLHQFPGFATDIPGRLSLWQPEGPLRLVFPEPLLRGKPEEIACPHEARP